MNGAPTVEVVLANSRFPSRMTKRKTSATATATARTTAKTTAEAGKRFVATGVCFSG
jgi:hypothetical protein